jgi:hypothetical protein
MKNLRLAMIVAGVLVAQVSGGFGQTNTLPLPPQQPAQRYIPEKRMYSPELGRDVQLPGHFSQPTPDGRVIEPPMMVPSPLGRAPLYIPGASGRVNKMRGRETS